MGRRLSTYRLGRCTRPYGSLYCSVLCHASLALGLFKAYRRLSVCAAGSLPADRRLPAAALIRRGIVFSVVVSSQQPVRASPPPKNSSKFVFVSFAGYSSQLATVRASLSLSLSLGFPTRTLPPPFLLHDAAQIAYHLHPSRAPPPRSVSCYCQTLPLSRDSYHIASFLQPVLHQVACPSS
jgi:hypothetical protein